MDHDSRDLIGPEHDEHDERDEPEHVRGEGGAALQAVRAPEVLALSALVLAVVSVLGLGLMNGSAYLGPGFYTTEPSRDLAVIAALLGAGLALVPVALGLVSLRRPLAQPFGIVAGAGVLLGACSCLLRLVVAARTAADESVPFVQF